MEHDITIRERRLMTGIEFTEIVINDIKRSGALDVSDDPYQTCDPVIMFEAGDGFYETILNCCEMRLEHMRNELEGIRDTSTPDKNSNHIG